jgi:hypothetical protein
MMTTHKRTVPLGHIIYCGPGLKGNPVKIGSGPAAVIPTSSPQQDCADGVRHFRYTPGREGYWQTYSQNPARG